MVRIFRHYVPKTVFVLGAVEAGILFLSVYLGVSGFFAPSNPTNKLIVGSLWMRALAYAALMVLLMGAMGLYARSLRDDLRGIVFRIGLAFLCGVLTVRAGLYLFPSLSIGGSALTMAFVTSALGIGALRALGFHLTEKGFFKRRTLIVGAGKTAAQVERRLRRKADWRDRTLVGYVNVPGGDPVVDERKVLEVRTTLLDLAREYRIHEIVVAIDERREHFPVNEILDCKLSGIHVIDLIAFFEQQTGKIQLQGLNPSAIIFADGFVQAVIKNYAHRVFDIVVSSLVLLLASPVMLVTAVAILVESGGRGGMLYRQERVGRNARRFQILKFRSMEVGAEDGMGPQWALPNDRRVTRVGAFIRKTRIDELPQVINVLKGEMSFVGPRPERPQFVEHLTNRIPFYELRHCVNPGITGWAQICYPYGASARDAREKLQYDLYYIKNYSLFLDLMILIQTAQVILWGKGAR